MTAEPPVYDFWSLVASGAGWFLDKVIVKDLATEGEDGSPRSFYFPCHRWLDEGLEDGLIERELLPAEPPKDSSKQSSNK